VSEIKHNFSSIDDELTASRGTDRSKTLRMSRTLAGAHPEKRAEIANFGPNRLDRMLKLQ